MLLCEWDVMAGEGVNGFGWSLHEVVALPWVLGLCPGACVGVVDAKGHLGAKNGGRSKRGIVVRLARVATLRVAGW